MAILYAGFINSTAPRTRLVAGTVPPITRISDTFTLSQSLFKDVSLNYALSELVENSFSLNSFLKSDITPDSNLICINFINNSFNRNTKSLTVPQNGILKSFIINCKYTGETLNTIIVIKHEETILKTITLPLGISNYKKIFSLTGVVRPADELSIEYSQISNNTSGISEKIMIKTDNSPTRIDGLAYIKDSVEFKPIDTTTRLYGAGLTLRLYLPTSNILACRYVYYSPTTQSTPAILDAVIGEGYVDLVSDDSYKTSISLELTLDYASIVSINYDFTYVSPVNTIPEVFSNNAVVIDNNIDSKYNKYIIAGTSTPLLKSTNRIDIDLSAYPVGVNSLSIVHYLATGDIVTLNKSIEIKAELEVTVNIDETGLASLYFDENNPITLLELDDPINGITQIDTDIYCTTGLELDSVTFGSTSFTVALTAGSLIYEGVVYTPESELLTQSLEDTPTTYGLIFNSTTKEFRIVTSITPITDITTPIYFNGITKYDLIITVFNINSYSSYEDLTEYNRSIYYLTIDNKEISRYITFKFKDIYYREIEVEDYYFNPSTTNYELIISGLNITKASIIDVTTINYFTDSRRL